VVNIFAREITDDLASLVKQVDEVVAKNADKKMAAFLVVLAEDADAAAPKLEELAKKHGIKNVPLTIFDGDAGPSNYKIAKDADVTVLMWLKRDVKVNHALKKGKLDAETTKKIVADTETILK
jgi:predicted TIM-barrel fold metal-dependent hydrolase